MKSIAAIVIGIILAGSPLARGQEVIRLPVADAPASANSGVEEKEFFSPIFNTQVVTNVSQPTLTRYAPAADTANGTSVIICPGGGFHILSINSEGVDVAKWLNAKGMTAFVLRYRLVPTGEDGVRDLLAKGREKIREDMQAAFPLAVADAVAAIKHVREHASELGVAPDRIGLMGFSAGGSITAAMALKYDPQTRPDFAAPIYAYLGVIGEAEAPKDAPPLFVLAASDDELDLARDSVDIYQKWLAAKKPAELHMYSKGGHGFGMKKQNLPSDQWIERFGDWLAVQGLLKK
jgi:acetyl esterase/lipase